MQNGYWNGEPTATFVGVTYEVTKIEDTPLSWLNSHVGKRRQGIQITYSGQTWIIDNEHGDGYYKVTKGFGSPRCGHKSVTNPINVTEIPDCDINTFYNYPAMRAENEAHDKYIEQINPEEFKRLKSLRSMINRIDKKVWNSKPGKQ